MTSIQQDILSKFLLAAANPYEELRKWKESYGKMMIGCAPMYFPEELIHAAGILPAVIAESNEPVTTGYRHIYPFTCGFTRSVIDSAMKGIFNSFDGLVFLDTCLQLRTAMNILRRHLEVSYFEFVQFPMELRRAREIALPEMTKELERLRGSLQEFAGRKIKDQAIEESISLYNKVRGQLRAIHDLRRTRPVLLGGREMSAVVLSSMLMPKEEYSQLLGNLLSELGGRSVRADGVRLFVAGHPCHAPKQDILDLIEAVGGTVVDDDLYTGHKYYAKDAQANKPNPLEALAERYLNMPPCPTKCDLERNWSEYLVEKVKVSQARGLVFLLPKQCEPYMFYYPDVKRALSTAGIPHLLIETEHEMISLQTDKTRLQAFVEMIKGTTPA